MPLDITLKPAQAEIVALPGSTIIQAYEVINNSSEYLTASSQVLPWSPLGINGSVDYDHATSSPFLSFSLSNSDLILGQSFSLAPHQKKQLVLKIKSNSNTPQSDAYYTFFINQNPDPAITDSTQASASGRIGSHLLLSYSLTQDPHSQFSLSHFQVSSKFIDILYPKLNFTAQAYNSSAYFAKISGKITITKNNLVLQQYDLFPDNVLAGASRKLTCLQDNNPVECTFSPPYWPGAYTATISLDPSLNASSVSTTFFVFPYTLALIIVIFSSIFWALRTYYHKQHQF